MMRDFFKSWRRKFGVVMLVMACVFAGWWVHGHSLATNTEGIWFHFAFVSAGIEFECDDFAHGVQSSGSYWSRSKTLAKLFVPYWSIVIPLTMLSTYLLLRKFEPSFDVEGAQRTGPLVERGGSASSSDCQGS